MTLARPSPGSGVATAWLPCLGLLSLALLLLLSWQLPLLEAHSFRQTQTAISSYWMAEGGPWLAYQTPVLGAPWSIPFEFPLFQWLALGLANLLPLNLDQSGRLLSGLFALATLWPLRHAILAVTGDRTLANLASGLLLLSPLVAFWSRAFMIESAAVFLSMSFLALVIEAVRRPRPWVLGALVVAACLAALVKITTFVGFALVAGCFVAVDLARQLRSDASPGAMAALRAGLPAAFAVVAALLVTLLWIGFGDALKQQTLWGHLLGSENLKTWNYGTWQQKISSLLWKDVAFGRAAREIFGHALVLPAAILVLAAWGRGLRALGGVLLLGYLAPFFLFANLHIVHNYYQVANAPFALALVACALAVPWRRGRAWLGLAATIVVAATMLFGLKRDFLPLLDASRLAQRTPVLAAYARANTAPDEVLLAFGLEWSSEVPYYATRRAMMVIDPTPVEVLRRMRTDPASYAGTHRVGMVIVCANALAARPDAQADYQALIQAATAGLPRHRVAGCDVFH